MMYINDPAKADAAIEEFYSAFMISEQKPAHCPMVYDVIGE
jgi:hypothetical protein